MTAQFLCRFRLRPFLWLFLLKKYSRLLTLHKCDIIWCYLSFVGLVICCWVSTNDLSVNNRSNSRILFTLDSRALSVVGANLALRLWSITWFSTIFVDSSWNDAANDSRNCDWVLSRRRDITSLFCGISECHVWTTKSEHIILCKNWSPKLAFWSANFGTM